MKKIIVDNKPHLCLFAIKKIEIGSEIEYNYGDSKWPWRLKVSWLAKAWRFFFLDKLKCKNEQILYFSNIKHVSSIILSVSKEMYVMFDLCDSTSLLV